MLSLFPGSKLKAYTNTNVGELTQYSAGNPLKVLSWFSLNDVFLQPSSHAIPNFFKAFVEAK